MTIEIQLKTLLAIEFDEESPEFKRLFRNFKTEVGQCCYEEFAEMIADHIVKHGVDTPIEGVGYVKINGDKQTIHVNGAPKEYDCPVNVEGEFDVRYKCEFETYIL